MSNDLLSDAAKLSDQELLARVQLLAQHEREATAALIAHLAVLDERRLYLAEGCSRLFVYCTQILHFSESAAYRRVEVARAARRYSVILTMLAEGSINLTTVLLLAPELTPANHRQLLSAAKHKSKEQVQELIVSLRPKPPMPSTIRKLPEPSRQPAQVSQSDEVVAPSPESSDPIVVRPPARPVVIPLAPERYKVQFTASQALRAKLQYAQNLLRHQIPDGDLAKVVDLAVTALIEKLEKRKFGAASRPRADRSAVADSRYVPAAVRRQVWARDGGRCAFVAQNGRRCDERAFLQFHHVDPYSAGGKATVDNIELRCRSHNAYEAELYFGPVRAESEFHKMRNLGL